MQQALGHPKEQENEDRQPALVWDCDWPSTELSVLSLLASPSDAADVVSVEKDSPTHGEPRERSSP
jgi:hypothetical protein